MDANCTAGARGLSTAVLISTFKFYILFLNSCFASKLWGHYTKQKEAEDPNPRPGWHTTCCFPIGETVLDWVCPTRMPHRPGARVVVESESHPPGGNADTSGTAALAWSWPRGSLRPANGPKDVHILMP